MTVNVAPTVTAEELSVADSRALFRAQVQDRLGIAPEEFLARLDRGEYVDTDSEDVVRLAMLAPFGR